MRNELKERLETLEGRLFMMNMIDRWTTNDINTIREIETEITEIKRELGR